MGQVAWMTGERLASRKGLTRGGADGKIVAESSTAQGKNMSIQEMADLRNGMKALRNTKRITIVKRDGSYAVLVECTADEVDAWLDVLAGQGVEVAYISCI